MINRTIVKLKSLKDFVLANLPAGSPLRDVMLSEDQELTVEEFLAKVDVWLKLLRRESP